MSTPRKHWAKTFAFSWLLACVTHFAMLRWLAGSGTISAVFSPGPHLSQETLAIIGAFVLLRLFVFLLAPAAAVSLMAWLIARCSPLPSKPT